MCYIYLDSSSPYFFILRDELFYKMYLISKTHYNEIRIYHFLFRDMACDKATINDNKTILNDNKFKSLVKNFRYKNSY